MSARKSEKAKKQQDHSSPPQLWPKTRQAGAAAPTPRDLATFIWQSNFNLAVLPAP
jgi:hypothetical protein